MKTGDIILIPFPFAELTDKKIRPAVVVATTKDKYKDIIVSAISSVVSAKISATEIILAPDNTNNLRASSVIKVDRIITLKKEDKIAYLGKLSDPELEIFRKIFKSLVD